MNPPDFLYFDLGNVLLHFDHQRIVTQMAAVAGVEEARVRSVIFESGLDRRYDTGAVDCRGFYDEFCRATNSAGDYAALRFAVSDIFWPNDPVIAIAERLRAAGHRLGILSNTCAAHWEFVIDGKYSVLNRAFETYALSYELRAAKPDPLIYSRAAELAGVAPSRIFFVDDRQENVAGAMAAGYDAVLYESPEKLMEDLATRGVGDI